VDPSNTQSAVPTADPRQRSIVSLADLLALLGALFYFVAKVLGLLDFVVFVVEESGLELLVGLVLHVQLLVQPSYLPSQVVNRFLK